MSNFKQNTDSISDAEHFARWLYIPRYLDKNGNFTHRFINLRDRNGFGEEGISGQILERAGINTILQCGVAHRWKSNDGTPKEEQFVGFAKANVGEIRNIADEPDTSIDVIVTQSEGVPFHAEIRFVIDGQLIKGNNQNPHFLRYKDKLKYLFAKDIFKI
jgi:hypothetical protein